MSHSTHVGFSAPPTTAFNCRSRGFPLLVRRYWLGLPLFLLPFTVGVGSITAVCKLMDLPRFIAAKSGPAALALGVGHILAAIASTNDPDDPLRRNRAAIAGVGTTPMQASAVGVGQHPDPVALMRGACVVRSHNSPSCREPQRGKVREDQAKASAYKHRAVLHPDVAGSNLTDNARHLCPKP